MLCRGSSISPSMMISVVVGTRPEIIKMAPVYFALRKARLRPRLVHSGQHYDPQLSEVFFRELKLPEPEAFLDVGSGSPGQQMGNAIIKFEREFRETKPACVLVEGDTNTVLAGAIASSKLGMRVGHVEAGLRSYDLRMPEELNRRLTDHVSDFLMAPTSDSVRILKQENVWGRIFKTGNTVIDATLRYLPQALRASRALEAVGEEPFSLATIHRAENVDSPVTLRNMVEILIKSPIRVVLPLHPRTDSRLEETNLKTIVQKSKNVVVLPPAGYFDMLALMKKSEFILTDSGGIQEEATSPVLRKQVFVLRESTERPEAVRAGYCKVVGTHPRRVLEAVHKFQRNPIVSTRPCPYGKGDAGEMIADIMRREL